MFSKKLSIKKLIFIFCILTACIIGIMALLTVGPKTWQAIKQMQGRYMLLALALAALSICLDGMVLKMLSHAAGAKVKFFYSIETIIFYTFLSAITPTVTGGEPLMIYMLTQKDMPFGKATSVILVRGILILSIIFTAAPVIVYFHGELIQNAILKSLFHYIAILLSLLIMFIIYASFNPLRSEEIVHKICLWIERSKALAKYAEKVEKKLNIWIEDFSSSLKEFFKYKKKTLLAAIILSGVSISANYSIGYAILRGLNFHLPILHVLMVQFVLYFLLYFSPTPGGTGIAEGGCYAMFASSVPHHLLGVFVILWRFFTVYLWVIGGGLLITKTIGLDILDKISNYKNSSSN